MLASLLSLVKSRSPLIRPGLLSQAAVYGGNVIGLSYYLKHSVWLKSYRKYIERRGDYGPDEPNDELNLMLNDIITKDLKAMASEYTPIAIYLTPGIETTHLGTIGTTAGGFVGVPVFYEFKDKNDIKDIFLVREGASGKEDNELIDCFHLSDKAKKYGIAREILLVNTLKVYINALLPFAVSFFIVLIYKEIQEGYQILKKPLYLRCLIYTGIIVSGLSLLRFLYRNVLHYYESEVEAKIAELGKEYVEGGVEYCTKELKRKSIPVEIKGEKLRIVKYIDDLFFKLMPSGIPVSTRLKFLKTHIEQKSKDSNQ